MKLRKAILQEHSKDQCSKIVAWVGDSQKRFDELFHLFMSDEAVVVQRSSWPLSYCVEACPVLIKNHFKQLFNKLTQPGNHDAVKRNGLRLLQYVDIPEKWQGEVLSICFNYLAAPTERVATKVFCMLLLAKLAKIYPDIISEICMIIEDQLPAQTPGFRSRAQKTLGELKRH